MARRNDVSAYSRPRSRRLTNVRNGVVTGPAIADLAVTTSRNASGSPSNPATCPNAYSSVCRLPQLWFWLPTQPSTATAVPSTVSTPSKLALGAATRLFALGTWPA
jgi:hypothetical protein